MQILGTILIRTPFWVWLLLAALIWFGLSRTKTREINATSQLIAPIIFVGLVLVKLILSGFAPMPLLGAISGIVLGALAVLWLKPARNTTRLASGRLRIEGEWISLAIIMIVFLANYAAAVIGSIAPHIITGAEFQYSMALINGFSAALMTLRTIGHLRTKTTLQLGAPA